MNEKYIDIHCRVKSDLKVDYFTTYPDYDEQLIEITDNIILAVREIKDHWGPFTKSIKKDACKDSCLPFFYLFFHS